MEMCGRCLFKCCEPMRMSLYDICNKRHVKHLSDSFEISPPQTKNTDQKRKCGRVLKDENQNHLEKC